MARTKLSSRTKKQLSNLTPHQKRTFKKAHASALKQYKNPSKRRSRSDSPEKSRTRSRGAQSGKQEKDRKEGKRPAPSYQ